MKQRWVANIAAFIYCMMIFAIAWRLTGEIAKLGTFWLWLFGIAYILTTVGMAACAFYLANDGDSSSPL